MDYTLDGELLTSYAAAGLGGQRLTVVPSLDVIVVFTGGNYDAAEPVYEITMRHILPALAGG